MSEIVDQLKSQRSRHTYRITVTDDDIRVLAAFLADDIGLVQIALHIANTSEGRGAGTKVPHLNTAIQFVARVAKEAHRRGVLLVNTEML